MGQPLLPLISVEALTTAALELVDESGDFSFPRLAKKNGSPKERGGHAFDFGLDVIIGGLRAGLQR
jgi:hypothetical protein